MPTICCIVRLSTSVISLQSDKDRPISGCDTVASVGLEDARKKFASFPFRNLVERIWISVIRLKIDDEEVVVAFRDTQHFVYLAT
jgi:hypothetical protein